MFSRTSDDSKRSSTTFNVDSVTYTLHPAQGIVNIISPNAYELIGDICNQNTISINGIKGMSDAATITFDLFLKNGESLTSTYQIPTDQDEYTFTSINNILGSNVGVCKG